MQGILRQASDRLNEEQNDRVGNYVDQLLQAFQQEPFAAPRKDPASAALADQLSEREIEVLQLLEEGLSNQEIASRLYITLNTVKAHLKSIYGKLDVKNRVQAIARGRELEII
jgi:LuxR family maltose regulon positive regulatory protein